MYDLDKISYAQQPPWQADYSPHAKGVNRRTLYESYWKNASEEDWKLMTMRYYANVSWIDDMMGRTLKALEKKGLLDNAIIVYTSDHGEMLGDRFYRFNKYNLYEGSVRIPMILAGSALPNSIEKNTISHDHVETSTYSLHYYILLAYNKKKNSPASIYWKIKPGLPPSARCMKEMEKLHLCGEPNPTNLFWFSKGNLLLMSTMRKIF